ncbi:MAG: 1-acyl-sn-glycerol-3-phosphate acyltransferase [Deltaproteobacteria bacterium]|nr:MAG: 1-acyl-sn-glycerol-3-phosphate acyltransferase [Deltaproteobacteria bacterium]
MTGQITIPIWMFILLLLIGLGAILDRILIPSTRWFLRRRINRVIDEISTRLDIEIKPFQLTKRQVLIDRLVYDAKVIEAMQKQSQDHNIPREVLQAKVLGYAKEIVPSFNAYLYFRIGYWLAKKVARLLYRVRVGLFNNEQFETVDLNSTVVFVMNHRSNMDYILVAFLAAERTALSYAVGEWARIWPLHTLIRALGAFFVRRKSGNPLYRKVLERYVHMATKEGVCQAVFLEGGLSRDGRLRQPKMGLIDYMLRNYEPEADRDIIFIPTGINYDRTLEDRSLLRQLDPNAEKRSRWFVIKTTVRFIWRSLVFRMLSRWQHFGYACVNFGSYVSMREYCKTHGINFSRLNRKSRFIEVEKLCRQLMDSIEKVIPVLPISLVATVFVKHSEEKLTAFDVEGHVNRLIEGFESGGAPVYVSNRSRVQNVVTALNMLKIRGLVIEKDGLFCTDPQMLDVLNYYANSIIHWHEIPKVIE